MGGFLLLDCRQVLVIAFLFFREYQKSHYYCFAQAIALNFHEKVLSAKIL